MSELKEPYEKEEFLHEIMERVIVVYPTDQTQMIFSRNSYCGYDVQLNLYEGSDMVFMGEDRHFRSLDEVYDIYLATKRIQSSL